MHRILAALLPAVLAGCSHCVPRLEQQATAAQQKLALDGVSRLRDAFNRGDCTAIYNEAEQQFRREHMDRDWLGECLKLRKTLGAWQSSESETFRVPIAGMSMVWVDMRGIFERGKYSVLTLWSLEGSVSRLCSLVIVGNDQRIYPYPRRPFPEPPRLMDPPPRDRTAG